jgi:cellulose synthase/poly-beta-1,6-N-acetylglucosamine synthase-like glycosyltransferase
VLIVQHHRSLDRLRASADRWRKICRPLTKLVRGDRAALFATCMDITVIIPAYNEAEMVAATIKSVQQQTLQPSHVIVVDDCSRDGTGDVARALGVTVICPPVNTGSKAGAQNLALPSVDTPFVVALDADTTLAPDALEKLFAAFDRPEVAAACGFVVPRHVETIWERGRYIEYLFAFSFYKQVQDYYGKPIIASGCFSMYRSDVLRACGGWSTRTMAEDMDLTWTFYQAGHHVRFVPEAVCYPVEPHTYRFLHAQLQRWSHGLIQNVRLHWRGLLDVPYLRSAVGVALWDATIASIGFLALIPLLAFLLGSPWPLLAYVIDGPAILVPVVAAAWSRGETWKAIRNLPAFFVIRTLNSMFFLRALWMELAMNRPLLVYEKGH